MNPALQQLLLGYGIFAGGALTSLIESIQTGTVVTGTTGGSFDTTISSVDPDRSVVIWAGMTHNNGGFQRDRTAYFNLTSATNVRLTRDSAATISITPRFYVVQFKSGVLTSPVQRGTVTIAGSALTGTAAITAVDLTKSVCLFAGHSNNSTNASLHWGLASMYFSSSSQVTLERQASNANVNTTVYQILEFSSDALQSNTQQFAVTIGGTSTNTGTATITSVDTTKSNIYWGGFQTDYPGTSDVHRWWGYSTLTNSTTVTATRYRVHTDISVHRGTVVEFKPALIASIQRGLTTIPSGTSTTAAISSVNTSVSYLNHLQQYINTVDNESYNFTQGTLTNATTVTISRVGSTTVSNVTSWEVIEST